VTTEHVIVEDVDGVRIITMNRPDKRNALTMAMYDAMATALNGADRSAEIGAVLIRANGGLFTGGNDLGDFMNNPPTGADSPVFRFLNALVGCGLPIVAAVEGKAVGVGTTMLLHCDLVYAAPSAQFHLPFVDLGLVPEAGSSLLLPRLLGPARAARMLMLGEAVDAETAAAEGLVTAVIPAEQLDRTARAKASALAAKPRQALRHTKALMRGDLDAVRTAMVREGEIFGKLLRSPEAMAAFQAFFAKKA